MNIYLRKVASEGINHHVEHCIFVPASRVLFSSRCPTFRVSLLSSVTCVMASREKERKGKERNGKERTRQDKTRQEKKRNYHYSLLFVLSDNALIHMDHDCPVQGHLMT